MTTSPVQKKLKLTPSAGQSLIDNLPDECLINIFSFLATSIDRGNSASVSKKWLHLLANMTVPDIQLLPSDPDQPEPFSRRLMGKKANDLRLAALAACAQPFRTLTHLSVMGLTSSITDYGLEIIAKASPSLSSLSIWDCDSVGDAGFHAVGKWCRDLERLSVISLPMLSDHGLISVGNNCLKLSVLSIESCQHIGSQSFEVIANKCLKLCAVTVIKCPLVKDLGIISLVSNLPELARLKISMMEIGDEVLRAIRDCGKALQQLHLEKIKGITETGYSWIGEREELQILKLRLCVGLAGMSFKMSTHRNKFAALREIDIRRCSSLTDEVLVELSTSAKLLRRFRLEECSGFSSKGVMEVLRNWRDTLKLLSFNKCSIIESQVTQPGDVLLVESYPCLMKLELKRCNGVGDDFLCLMGLACNQVKQVSLVGMNTFTDMGLIRLLMFLKNRNSLTSFELSNCGVILGRTLYGIVTELGAGLRALKLERCSGVNDWIGVTAAMHCGALEELNVNGCEISDISLQCLMQTGKDRLQLLSLAGCTKITDEGLKWLEQSTLDKMKFVDIRNCPRISEEGVASLQETLLWCKNVCR